MTQFLVTDVTVYSYEATDKDDALAQHLSGPNDRDFVEVTERTVEELD